MKTRKFRGGEGVVVWQHSDRAVMAQLKVPAFAFFFVPEFLIILKNESADRLLQLATIHLKIHCALELRAGKIPFV